MRRGPKLNSEFLSTGVLLKADYELLNLRYFNNKLPKAHVRWSRTAKHHKLRLRPKGGYGWYRVLIRLSQSQFSVHPELLVPWLLNTMLKIDCRERGFKTAMFKDCIDKGRKRIRELGFQILED